MRQERFSTKLFDSIRGALLGRVLKKLLVLEILQIFVTGEQNGTTLPQFAHICGKKRVEKDNFLTFYGTANMSLERSFSFLDQHQHRSFLK